MARLRASDNAHEHIATYLRYELAPVVITLREAGYWPHRNSNLPEWLRFAEHLKEEGEKVIFVRDTAKAAKPLAEFLTWPKAALNLDVRMALYERARFCFFVANGPAGLAMFSNVPHVQFQTQYPGAQCPQWPWAAEDQRLICALDSYENLSREWERIKGTLTSVT